MGTLRASGLRLALAGVLWASTGFSAIPPGEKLFVIDRSLNSNQLVYTLKRGADGSLADDPVHAYWLMHETGGGIEGLTVFEEAVAYGIHVRNRAKDSVQFSLRALPKRIISARTRTGGTNERIRATTKIMGSECEIESIFIHSVGHGIFSSIKYVEVTGTSVEDGRVCSEKIPPKNA